jgi:sugar transferase (PEP-CTERM/EpsH1 system associated)
MNILWLNAGLLLPLDKGGRLRTWHLMRHLAAHHSITYLAFVEPAATDADRNGMREVCARLETIPRRDPQKGTWRFRADAARFLFDPVPYAVAKYRAAAYRRRVESLLSTGRYDAVVCDFLPPVVNLPDRLPCSGVLFTHNVEAEIWRRHAETARTPVPRALLRSQWRRMRRFERSALSRFDLVLAVSDADRSTFERLYPGAVQAPLHVVRTGVDTAFFTPRPEAVRPAHLVFTGSMDWLPNADAMLYFAADILPRIRQDHPDATLTIVGRAPTPAVSRLARQPGIQVTGRVDDVRPYIAEATAYVVPLRVGGGTRLKIFEAMAMGKAVVSTTVGAEGLPLTPGHDVLIADTPPAFAESVSALLRDAVRRRQLEIAARRLVVEHYDWSTVASDFEEALQRVGRGPAARREPTGGQEAQAARAGSGAREM